MKTKVLTILIILFSSLPLFAQEVDTAWVRRYNGPGNSEDATFAIVIDDSGDVYVTGWSQGSGTGRDYATIKYVQKSNQKPTSVHQKPKSETEDWKIYQYKKPGFEIRYPENIITVSQEGEKVILIHSIPFEHPNPCDFIGDAPPLKELTDFRVSLQIINKNFKETIMANEGDYVVSNFLPGNTLQIEPGYIDKINIGSLKGYRITEGVEGCGYYAYYFPLDENNTLKVERSFITELQPIIVDNEKYLKIPGVIPPDKEEKLFNQIVSTFRFLK